MLVQVFCPHHRFVFAIAIVMTRDEVLLQAALAKSPTSGLPPLQYLDSCHVPDQPSWFPVKNTKVQFIVPANCAQARAL